MIEIELDSNWSCRPLSQRRWAVDMEQKIPGAFGLSRGFGLTNSCTSAIEIAAGVLNVGPGDEWLIPSYTFGTVAGVFARRGAKIKWVDSGKLSPSATLEEFQSVWTPETKGIVIMPYGGFAMGMRALVSWAQEKGLNVIEDAAHGFGGAENGQVFGSFGDFATFSFHDTKNLSCGEGGAVVYDPRYKDAVNMWLDKGTDKQHFLDGLVSHYQWKVPAGAFGMSELHARLLAEQWAGFMLRQEKRVRLWRDCQEWSKRGEELGIWKRPPNTPGHPAHLFYLELKEDTQRNRLFETGRPCGIHLTRHFYPLHQTALGKKLNDTACPNAEFWDKNLFRLNFLDFSEQKFDLWLKEYKCGK